MYPPGGMLLTQKKIRVCPRCGSAKIREAPSSVGGWLVPTTYYCESEDCDYQGPIYVEVETDEIENLRLAINGDSKAEHIN
jgi:hypothetical protein